jgi:hypothetical protein
MSPDPRHLRARWILAALGWGLWAITLTLPIDGSGPQRVWIIYPGAVNELVEMNRQIWSAQHVIEAAAVAGFIVASGALAISPVLMRLHRSHNPAARRWRWLGLGLLAMIQLSVVFIRLQVTAQVPLWIWSIHLFVSAHVVLCLAIIPWPGEHSPILSGFEVLIPSQHQPPD